MATDIETAPVRSGFLAIDFGTPTIASTTEASEFASAWAEVWTLCHGTLLVDRLGRKFIGYPNGEVDKDATGLRLKNADEQRGAVKAMLAVLDAIGRPAAQSIFAHALDARES